MDKTTDEYLSLISSCNKIFVNPDNWKVEKKLLMKCINCQRDSSYRPRDFLRHLQTTNGKCRCINKRQTDIIKQPKIEKKLPKNTTIEIQSLPIEQQYDLEKYYNN